EVLLGGVVGGDPGRHDEARSALRTENRPVVLGKEGVRVEPSSRTEGIATRNPNKLVGPVNLPPCILELSEQPWVLLGEGSNQSLARRCIRSARNLGTSMRKPLLFLNFRVFPRRVPQHHIEASLGKDPREGEVPME